MVKEIKLDNLEGSWQKQYAKGVQDAGLVIWRFSDENIPENEAWKVLNIYVSDVFSGDFVYLPRKVWQGFAEAWFVAASEKTP